jgi:hypothetical protein
MLLEYNIVCDFLSTLYPALHTGLHDAEKKNDNAGAGDHGSSGEEAGQIASPRRGTSPRTTGINQYCAITK